jgi:4-alpha-glucanotransferase
LPEECKISDNQRYINYELLYKTRFHILRKAYARFNKKQSSFQNFKLENYYWLDSYCEFMAIKNYYKDQDFYHWDKNILLREISALYHIRELCAEDIGFYEFLQFKFYEQWDKLHTYANSKGICIIGDIPIYTALDSADCWNWPELFQFEENMRPVAVAGCPPDSFAKTGQLWGNPLYNWDYHKNTNYDWWIKRIQYSFKLYDMVRIDHFRGFDGYYSIPYGNKTAELGTWKKGPGIDLFHKLNKKLGKLNIIAEDLGFLTDSVVKLLKESGYPGMKIIQFAFNPKEDNIYIPYNYTENSVVYTGTHDNDTIIGWFKSLKQEERNYALDYLVVNKTETDIHWEFIRLAMASAAAIAIIPIQDYLGLGTEARINIPSTLGGNWTWRMLPNELTPDIVTKIGDLTRIYGRFNKAADLGK